MKQKLTIIFGTIVLVLMMFGCPNGQTEPQAAVVSSDLENGATAYITVGLNESRTAAGLLSTDNSTETLSCRR